MAVCINCHIILRTNLQRNEYHAVDFSRELVTIIEEWCGHEISDNDQLCQECVNLVIQEGNNRIQDPDCTLVQKLGHACVCISCGLSLSRRVGRRRHKLTENSIERRYLENKLFPRQIPNEAWTCYACWMRAHRNARQSLEYCIKAEPADLEVLDSASDFKESTSGSTHPSSSVTLPSSESNSWANRVPSSQDSIRARETICLGSYTRTPDTPNHCFVPDCINTERLRVSCYIKRCILTQQKIYVTESARICLEHSMLHNWDILNEYKFLSTFTAIHIENMLNLLCTMPAR